jgi:hypothetical protein
MVRSITPLLERLSGAFSAANPAALRELANAAIGTAALENDPLKAEIAVLTYALEKLLGKPHFQKERQWAAVMSGIARALSDAVGSAGRDDTEKVKKALAQIASRVSQIDAEYGHYLEDLVDKARVKQASTAYAFGLSLSQACILTGANKQELFSYIGYTRMHEETPPSASIRERVKSLKSMLKKGSV